MIRLMTDSSPRTVDLYASGPGLMLHSPSAVRDFEFGVDYSSSLRPGEGAVGEALSAGRVVLLSTGSPGLNYTLVFHEAGSLEVPKKESLAAAQFSLVVTDGKLLVRDGYATTCWGAPEYAAESVVFQNGFYFVDARWLPSNRYGHMQIHLILGRTADPPAGCAGWVNLDYVAS